MSDCTVHLSIRAGVASVVCRAMTAQPASGTVGSVSDAADAPNLTPVQIRTLDALRRSGDPLVFDPDLVADIRTEMRVALDHFAERLQPKQEVFISKHKIATALDCEEFHLIPDDFEWKPATAKGQVAHRAIQLLLSWRGEANPSDLVDEAMARLADEERGIGMWIAALSPADEADLRHSGPLGHGSGSGGPAVAIHRLSSLIWVVRVRTAATGSPVSVTRSAGRPCARSVRRSPVACADFSVSKPYVVPGISTSSATGWTSCRKRPVAGPPLCSCPVECTRPAAGAAQRHAITFG